MKIYIIKYSAVYQFSPQSMAQLIQILIQSPSMIIPSEFKLRRNAVILNLFRNLLCTAETNLGKNSFASVDIVSFSQLYRASINKVKIDISTINVETIKPLRNRANQDIKHIRFKIRCRFNYKC